MFGLETIIARNNRVSSAIVNVDDMANLHKANAQDRVVEAVDELIDALNATMPKAGDYARREDYREERDSIVTKVRYVEVIRNQAEDAGNALRAALA